LAVSEFKRADGLIVCKGCGALYSQVFQVCPECKRSPVEEEEEDKPIRRFICNQRAPCPVAGADGVCCISCDRLQRCKKVCPTALSYEKTELDQDDILCEWMVEIELKRVIKDESTEEP